MSLDVTLTAEVYTANITHNLNTMADAAGIYIYLWRPEELGIEKAGELIEPLKEGIAKLKADPEHFRKFDPTNGWGDYDGLVRFITQYLHFCNMYPSARISVSR